MSLMKSLILLVTFAALPLLLNAATAWKNPDLEAEPAKPAAPARVQTKTPLPETAEIKLPEGALALQRQSVCSYSLSYRDKGSGGRIDGAFYRPQVPQGYYMIGDFAQGNYHEPADCVTVVKAANEKSRSLLRKPVSWERRWTDKGSGANMDGAIWHAVSDSDDYVCLGSVAMQGYRQPSLPAYRCVHRCLTEEVPRAEPVWSTRGTGAKHKIFVYKLPASNGFTAVTDPASAIPRLDLKGNSRCNF